MELILKDYLNGDYTAFIKAYDTLGNTANSEIINLTLKNFLIFNKGYRVTEMPIVFTDRTVGQSKMNRNIIYEAISRKPKGHDFIIERKENEQLIPRHMNVTGG